VRHIDAMETRRLKGDARMGELVRRALQARRHSPTGDVSLRVRFARAALPVATIEALVGSIVARPAPYKSGRLALRARLISEARRVFRASERLGADEPWFEKELAATDEFRSLLDHLWPAVSPTALVGELLSSRSLLAELSTGLFTDDEWPLLWRDRSARLAATAWTTDDLALLDEASSLIVGRTRTYGHVVIDEAQDLTPMQFRMVARRAPSGSMTVLGDLAQATGPWNYDGWGEILDHLPAIAPVRRDELTLGYRAPGQVLDLASKLLPVAAPAVGPTTSIRDGQSAPRIRAVAPEDLLSEALAEAQALEERYALVAIVAPVSRLVELAKLVRHRPDVGLLDRDAMSRPITVVGAPAAKGLEFDAVVVVEPAAIVDGSVRGLRLLYVAMTRPIQHLSIVHAEPLPEALRT